MAVIGIAGLVLGAVGTGMSYYSQRSAAETGSRLALLNAQAQTQQVMQEGRIAAAGARLQELRSKKMQEAAYSQATAMRERVEAGSRAAQENIRRQRQEFSSLIARQRAAAGKAGVVPETGSPLELLEDSAEQEALLEAEMRHQDEIARRVGFREADIEQLGGQIEGINQGLYSLNAAAAISRSQAQESQIKLDLMSAQAGYRGQQTAALGGLLSNVGGLAMQGYDLRQRIPRQTSYASYR